MIECHECNRHFHEKCCKLSKSPQADEYWACPKCAQAIHHIRSLEQKLQNSIKECENKVQSEALKLQKESFKELVDQLKATRLEPSPDEVNLALLLKRQSLMELPYFDGNILTWARFKNTFELTTKEGGFSDLENLNRLQKYLKGDAFKLVNPLLMDHNNLKTILHRLNENFGNADAIYQNLINCVLGAKNPKLEAPKTMIDFVTSLENLIVTMNQLKRPDLLVDSRLVKDLTSKLPPSMFQTWTKYVLDKKASSSLLDPYVAPTLEEFHTWMKPHKDLATVLLAEKHREGTETKTKEKVNVHLTQKIKPEKKLKCFSCDGNHKTTTCDNFKKMDVKARRRLLKTKKVCYSCCNYSNHKSEQCKIPVKCTIDGCKKAHHPMVHENLSTANRQAENPPEEFNAVNCQVQDQNKVYYQIIPVTLKNGDNKFNTFAFFDSGSSVSLVNSEIVKILKIKGSFKPMTLAWTNGEIQEDFESMSVEFKITGPNGKTFNLKNMRTIKDLALPTQSVNIKTLKNKFNYLKNIDLKAYDKAEPTILLGLPHAYLFRGIEERCGGFNEPIARLTMLGWMLYGSNHGQSNKYDHLFSMEEISIENDFRQMMQDYFSTENFGVKLVEKMKSSSDERALRIMEQTLNYSNGQYEIGLLWKEDKISFPNSYQSALNRLKLQERKMNREPELRTWYSNKIKEYEEKGYLRKATLMEQKESERTYYIPHFVVVNLNKNPPKRRLVFDAAAKIGGESLNSKLLSGPDGLSSLVGVLIRFREGKYAVSGDIQEMFHQVRIRKEDQESQKILFRDDPTEKPVIYIMQVMTFGATCSPACAQFVKNQNALKFQEKYPEEVKAIIDNHYVDDYLDSFDSVEKANMIINNVIKIQANAHFNLRNFISNSSSILECIPEDKRMQKKVVELGNDEQTYEKVLGIYWDTEKDALRYRVKNDNFPDWPTKREMLSIAMSVYDPLGLISNITIESRVMMQELWRTGTNWDEKIPQKMLNQWISWTNRLEQLKTEFFPRCYSNLKGEIISRELHVFVDASDRAYAAVIYMRTIGKESIDLCIVAAKARVAPNKLMSIPRLELQAAVLGTRLVETVVKEIRLNYASITFWSDSRTVLAWINSEPRNYKQFIAHRVSEILDSTTTNQWRWVDSKNNPADEATKTIIKDSIWVTGPDFLYKTEYHWPSNKQKEPTLEELKPVHMIKTIEIPNLSFINEENFSSWKRLKRSTAILIKFVEWIRVRKDQNEFNAIISVHDLQRAENLLIRKAQWNEFTNELKSLSVGENVPKDSPIRNLTPFLDEKGVLRSRTRYENARVVPEGATLPAILPKNHYITRLILISYHEQFLHKKMETAIAAVRQKYWVIDIRAVMKKIKFRCQKCKNDNAKPIPPIMAALPKCRLHVNVKPFTYTGVDYFGPMNVSIGRRVEKRWGALFTCLNTRAVHIELANALSTDAFFLCLKNVIHRRGKILQLYSDNGTNFVGANNEINRIKERLADDGIEWFFNPPASPHFGGVWERMVKEVKSLLPSVQRTMPEDELRSLLIQIEFIINSRPLTHIPLYSDDDEVLTPNHFLLNQSGATNLSLNDVTKGEVNREHWKRAEQAAKVYWDRWIQEYLPTLGKRSKWQEVNRPIKLDDIVAYPDESQKGVWIKAIVTELRPGKDGQIRSVRIRTPNRHELIKSVSNLLIFDVRKQNTEKESDNIPKFMGMIREIPSKPINKDNWGKKKTPDIEKIKLIAAELKAQNESAKPKVKKRGKIRPWNGVCLTILACLMIISQAFGNETKGLIAYDCTTADVNLTTYSLLDVASCLPPTTNLTTTQVSIQVLQRSAKTTARVYQCKVIMKRSIKHCGMHSHTSDYQYGYNYIVKEFTPDECLMAHVSNSIHLADNYKISQLKRNSTTRGEALIVGHVQGSTCQGGTYTTPFYTWVDALVYYEYDITLFDYMATVDIENDQIQLKRGLVCPYSHGKCLDSEEGYSTWSVNLNRICEDVEFEVLYEGNVNKTVDNGDKQATLSQKAVYSTISDAHLFSIRTREATKICGYDGYKTDHPRILIIEVNGFRSPFRRRPNGKNYDLFTYFNSKITLVENYIGQKLNDVYTSVMTEMCKLDKTIMETKLTLARLNPTEFVSSIVRRSGYTAVVAGEVIHILQCKPVYVTPRSSERCYQEIPVTHNNQSMYLAPVTRIVQARGTEIDCTPLLPAKFMFGGRWYTSDGRLRESTTPNKLTTDIITSWSYTPLPNLMESGVYDAKSIEKMRSMINEQGDRRAASTVLHKVMTGQNPNLQGFKLDAFVTETVIDSMINKYWHKFLTWSTWFGTATSTIIGAYMIGRLVKFVIDTIMHGRILYDIYGFGWQLIASFWDSLTTFLSHRNALRQVSVDNKPQPVRRQHVPRNQVDEIYIPMNRASTTD